MNMNTEQDYLNALKEIRDNGYEQLDRTGVGTRTIPGMFFKFDISGAKIPLWNTRKINHRNQWVELIWFLNGKTDVKWLQERGINIWNNWIKADGTIGPGYGKQWTNFEGPTKFVGSGCLSSEEKYTVEYIDSSIINHKFTNTSVNQFKTVVNGIKSNHKSRRHIVTLWNPTEVEDCSLPPCHGTVIQFLVNDRRELDTLYYQRSADMVLGWCPWQYAMLANIVGKLTNTTPKTLSCTIGSAHIYNNQLEGIETQLKRDVQAEFPTLQITRRLNYPEDIVEFSPLNSIVKDDYLIHSYSPQPFIKFPIAV